MQEWQDPDLACFERVRAGEESALTELYERHGRLVYSLAHKILRNPADAEDVLQETLVQAWQQSKSYSPTRGRVSTWLLTIARSRALDRVRRASTRQRASDRLEQDPTPSPAPASASDATEHGQLRDRVEKALSELDPRQRKALELAYWGGMSHSKISSEMNEPLGTVKSWVRSGLLRLRQEFPKEEWT